MWVRGDAAVECRPVVFSRDRPSELDQRKKDSVMLITVLPTALPKSGRFL
jgi:hypothetical protein